MNKHAHSIPCLCPLSLTVKLNLNTTMHSWCHLLSRDVKILVMHKCEQVCQQVEVMTGNRTMNNNAQLYIISLAFMWKPFVWKHEYEATDVQSIVFQIQVPLMQRVYKLQLSTQKQAQWLSFTLSHCGNQLKVPYYMLFWRISQCKNIVKLKWREHNKTRKFNDSHYVTVNAQSSRCVFVTTFRKFKDMFKHHCQGNRLCVTQKRKVKVIQNTKWILSVPKYVHLKLAK